MLQDSAFVTARSFFSKDNEDHPSVQENLKLKKRLTMLNSIRDTGGISTNASKIEEHKAQLRGEFDRFKELSSKEVERLRK